MKVSMLATALFVLTSPLYSQSTATPAEFIFLPAGHHFPPLRANVQEPRIGLTKNFNAGEMRVDIGNAVDVFGYRAGSTMISAGIDFFAYGLVSGVEGSRLQ